MQIVDDSKPISALQFLLTYDIFYVFSHRFRKSLDVTNCLLPNAKAATFDRLMSSTKLLWHLCYSLNSIQDDDADEIALIGSSLKRRQQ
jgi:hypothetical protein